MAQKTQPHYDCIELVDATNIYGSNDCKTWVLAPPENNLIPELTPQETHELSLVLIQGLFIAYCFRQLRYVF